MSTDDAAVPILVADQAEIGTSSILEVTDLSGGKVALRSLVSGRYLTISSNGGPVVVTAESIGPWETMRFVDAPGESGRIAISTANGRHLAVVDRDVIAPVAESVVRSALFDVVPQDEAMQALQKQTSCCGVEKFLGIGFWDRKAHSAIVHSAVDILSALQTQLPDARLFVGLWAVQKYQDGVEQGLVDADQKSEYKGGATFRTHFYDPDTGGGLFGSTTENALTEAQRWAARSAEKARQISQTVAKGATVSESDYYDAGYLAGLALHYVSDLTQPMHAANFANILPTLSLLDWRHAGFEQYAEDHNANFPLDPKSVKPSELEYPSVGAAVIATARFSKRVFVEKVQRLADAKVHIHGKSLKIDNAWGDEAVPAMQEALPNARRMTAAFLLQWARLNAFWRPATRPIPTDHSSSAPAFAQFLEKVLMAWPSSDQRNTLWCAFEEIGWSGPKQICPGQEVARTWEAPAVAVYRDRLYVAWHGLHTNELYVASSADGVAWSAAKRINKALIKDYTSPALAVYDDRIFLIWADYGKEQDGPEKDGIWRAVFDARTGSWSANAKIPGIDTRNSPSAAVWNDRLYLAWAGYHSGEPIFYTSFDRKIWEAQRACPGDFSTPKGPAIAAHNGRLVLAWRADDGNDVITSKTTDGVTWAVKERIPLQGFESHQDVTLAAMPNESLALGVNRNWEFLYTLYGS